MPESCHRIDLAKPLLIIQQECGMLACGYLNVETFNKTGEAAAIVAGVSNYDEMRAASVVSVSEAAKQLGVNVGDMGAEALAKFAGSS